MKGKILLLILSFNTLLQSQTLSSAIEEVIATHPAVLEKLKNFNQTKEDINIAEAGYHPKIDLTFNVGYEETKRENYAGITTLTNDGIPVEVLGVGVYQSALTYTHNIFNGFKTTHSISQQKHRTNAAAYSYIQSVNDTAFTMTNNYLEVIKNEELRQISQENIDINNEILIKVKKLYEFGLTTLSEVNKIESSLSLAKSNYVVQENTLLDVKYKLKRTLGRFINTKNMQKPKFESLLPKTLEEASLYALKNNPSLRISQYNIKLAQSTYDTSKAAFYPSVDLEISQSLNKNTSATQGNDERFKAMLYLKYNIFNGFADSALIQQSRSKIHQETQIKYDLNRQVLEGLELSWISNQKQIEQLKYLKEYKKFAFKTLSLYSKEYALGRRSLLDLLSAQNDFIASKVQVLTTEYSILFAKYRILDAMGILVPTLLGKNNTTYLEVGLSTDRKQNYDTLPVKNDSDKDSIKNSVDICPNSLLNETKDIFGCKVNP